MKLFFRALGIGLLRFVALMALLVALDHLEVDPLPLWTLSAAVFFVHFAVTFMFARWVFRRRPSVRDMIFVMAVLVAWEIFLEAIVLLFLTHWDWARLRQSYTWQTAYINALYIIAVLLAGWRRRRIGSRLVEGLNV